MKYMRKRSFSESGQVFAEYALIIAVIALGCLVGVVFVSGAIDRLFGSTTRPLRSSPFKPPVQGQVDIPTSVTDCENGGWRDFPQFADEAACTAFVQGSGP